MTPGTGRETGQANCADLDADKLGHGMPQRRHHAAYLPVAALVEGQLDLRLPPGTVRVGLAAQEADILGGLRHAVIEHDAAPEAAQRVFVRHARHGDPVGLRDMITRVGHLKQKIAVVGQEDEALAVGVESSDRTQHRLAPNINKICDHLPGMAVRVGARRDNPLRLVHRQIIPL